MKALFIFENRNMRMKMVILFLAACAGCTGSGPEKPVSTVDSNTIVTGDSIPAILHLDDAREDSSFSVALDSIGPTVDAADTFKH